MHRYTAPYATFIARPDCNPSSFQARSSSRSSTGSTRSSTRPSSGILWARSGQRNLHDSNKRSSRGRSSLSNSSSPSSRSTSSRTSGSSKLASSSKARSSSSSSSSSLLSRRSTQETFLRRSVATWRLSRTSGLRAFHRLAMISHHHSVIKARIPSIDQWHVVGSRREAIGIPSEVQTVRQVPVTCNQLTATTFDTTLPSDKLVLTITLRR